MWLTGSLNGPPWETIVPLLIAIAVLVPAALLLARSLRGLQLGDDAARGVGVRVEPARAAIVLVGVGLVGFGTAAAGPVAFVALISAPIARRLIGSGRLALLAAGLVGALLLTLSDVIARQAFGDVELPVGDHHRHPRRAVPAVAAGARPTAPGRGTRGGRATHADRRGADPRLRRPRGQPRADGRDPAGPDHVDRRRQRVRQVHAAARARAAAQAARPGTVLLDGEDIHRLPTKTVATRLGILPQSPIAPERHQRHRSRRARPLPAPAADPPVDRGRRDRRRRGDDADGDPRPRRAAGRRAVGRPAPAGVDRDGARAGDRRPAARRADHVPRPRPPGRRPRAARRPQRAAAARRSCSCSTTSTRPRATRTT